jgi:hypothetical protein
MGNATAAGIILVHIAVAAQLLAIILGLVTGAVLIAAGTKNPVLLRLHPVGVVTENQLQRQQL